MVMTRQEQYDSGNLGGLALMEAVRAGEVDTRPKAERERFARRIISATQLWGFSEAGNEKLADLRLKASDAGVRAGIYQLGLKRWREGYAKHEVYLGLGYPEQLGMPVTDSEVEEWLISQAAFYSGRASALDDAARWTESLLRVDHA